MQKFMLFVCTLVIAGGTYAQESKTFKTKFNGANKRVVMDIDAKQLDIEGYNGDEIVIEGLNVPSVPKEADGLRPLSAAGVDNTNMGLSTNVTGDILKINVVMKGKALYKMKVPKELSLVVKKRNSCSCNETGMSISNIEGSIEVNTNYEAITLTNVTGPVVANTHQGEVKVVYDEKMPDKPSSIVSYGGNIDVTVSEKAKVLFSINSSDGNMFTDLDLKPYTPDAKALEEEKKIVDELRSNAFAAKKAQWDKDVTVADRKSKQDAETIVGKSKQDMEFGVGQSLQSDVATSGTIRGTSPGVSVNRVNSSDDVFVGGQNGVFYSYWDGQSKYWDSDRNAPRYVLNDAQTKISIRATRGNVYLRKKK